MLFPAPTLRFLAAVPPTQSGHVPAAVWLVLALNVAVVAFFAYRIVGLLRSGDALPTDADAPPRSRHASGALKRGGAGDRTLAP